MRFSIGDLDGARGAIQDAGRIARDLSAWYADRVSVYEIDLLLALGEFEEASHKAEQVAVRESTDLARFVSALDHAFPSAILQAETVGTMLSRPAAPLWERKRDDYALGWRVRPAREDATWWHTGSLPGSTAVLYRTPSGLAWVALFNASPDANGNEFLVDLIAAMGSATLQTSIPWRSWPSLAIPAGAGFIVVVLVQRGTGRTRDAQAQKKSVHPARRSGSNRPPKRH